jgi:hypothetical protein
MINSYVRRGLFSPDTFEFFRAPISQLMLCEIQMSSPSSLSGKRRRLLIETSTSGKSILSGHLINLVSILVLMELCIKQ